MRVRLNHEALANLLSQSRLSQNHWAIKLGLSSGHLADLVNGRHPYPAAVTREKLLKGLGVEFDSLFRIETPGEATTGGGDFRSQLEAALSDRYLIDDVVGKGGMGTVYRARDVKHGRPVALKVIMPDAIATLGNLQFLAEIRRTASLQHPNILPLLDSGEAAECPYLVTPLVRDGSLADLINKHGPMGPRTALQWLRGVCNALAYAHAQRVVHCDIKPDNVLISSEQAIVMDFGRRTRDTPGRSASVACHRYIDWDTSVREPGASQWRRRRQSIRHVQRCVYGVRNDERNATVCRRERYGHRGATFPRRATRYSSGSTADTIRRVRRFAKGDGTQPEQEIRDHAPVSRRVRTFHVDGQRHSCRTS